jgi:hypothetical protein
VFILVGCARVGIPAGNRDRRGFLHGISPLKELIAHSVFLQLMVAHWTGSVPKSVMRLDVFLNRIDDL